MLKALSHELEMGTDGTEVEDPLVVLKLSAAFLDFCLKFEIL
jgi:hypothetical protein